MCIDTDKIYIVYILRKNKYYKIIAIYMERGERVVIEKNIKYKIITF